MTRRSTLRRVLVSRETLFAVLAVLLASALCIGLGFWQFGRFEHKRDVADVIHANFDAEPVPLQDVLPSPESALAPEDDWTPVTLRGSYCTDAQCLLYVRNRQLDGQVGFWQLVPYRTEDGTTLLVVRGWVTSQGDVSEPVSAPPVPEGEQEITVRLRPAEPTLDREIPPGQVHSVNPPQIDGLLPEHDGTLVRGAYGDLEAEDPSDPRPAALPDPETGLGPHLSYAFQWWIFALFFPAALIYRTRRTIQDLDEAEGEGASADGTADEGAPARTTTDHRPRRAAHSRPRGQDEEEEDALIDHRDG
ncbi:SURF1 family cytochrome oxidase biogenesis protein [Brachybacterium tyrofermentans]|uniref:SURF1 family cytochrome oxidase biogenesis protein n=1 Tax=Brachybacterium tyrofermentans TaxID=47848 RepID=UPI0018690FC2|nr:SURF1 family protein [Brachybacterium tyrofermentans]